MQVTRTMCISFGLLLCLQLGRGKVIPGSSTPDEAKELFEREARIETEALLNSLFTSQRDFFAKVRAGLPAHTKRAADIDKFVVRMNAAIAERDVKEKDRMWRASFEEFHQSPLLLNKEDETAMTKEAYEHLLDECGLKQVVSNFLMEIATYFWKMARASGKVVEVTMEEQLNKLKSVNINEFSLFF